jgi:hypothetical protein
MTRLKWDSREYESGVDRGVYYPVNGSAESWSGLLSVNEAVVEVAQKIYYRDGQKHVNLSSPGSFAGSISAFSLPSSFLADKRKAFGLSYRTRTTTSYKIHLVYNVSAIVSNTKYAQSQPIPFSLDISTKPVSIPDASPSAHLIIDESTAWPEAIHEFEAILYGTDDSDARLPLPTEVYEVFNANSIFQVIDNGDGTYTMNGPDWAFAWVDPTTVTVDWPKIVYVDTQSYLIRSW